ncbi:MAG: Holliday junction branch migration protein RuvA [Rickettsiales bacterium]|nr:Holliday junction branch migration protein RuvA [Rickettsiales bacterium]
MIGKLRGRIDSVEDDSAIIDVGGVGYLVYCNSRVLAGLHNREAVELTIETHVREDHIHLYGFLDTVERDWFRLLGSVQGVGNKTALAILGAYAPTQLAQAIIAKDISAFKAISGIGPKLAERIVTELKDKVAKLPLSGSVFEITAAASAGKKKSGKETAAKPVSLTEDAISALVNLGYTRSEAYAAALKAAQSPTAGLDDLIKLSLKELVRR